MARLSLEHLSIAVEALIDAGATGVVTGNGFGPPCSIQDIQILKKLCRGRCSIKAAGGIHTPENAIDLLSEGANLIASSRALDIIKKIRRSTD